MFNYSVFARLCAEKRITPYRVSVETGIATATLTEWKKHFDTNGESGYVPKADKVLLIANLFGVPIEEFIKKGD